MQLIKYEDVIYNHVMCCFLCSFVVFCFVFICHLTFN